MTTTIRANGGQQMYGVVWQELAVEVMAGLPDEDAREEVLALMARVRARPDAYPDVRDVGATEEVREAFGGYCWIHYQSRDGALEVRDVGWLH